MLAFSLLPWIYVICVFGLPTWSSFAHIFCIFLLDSTFAAYASTNESLISTLPSSRRIMEPDDTILMLIFFLSFPKLVIAMPIFRSLALRH
ncbi:hypothetical protein BJ912DRAFT_987939 [Pholiota molesta]|nr:hypothetical protein BJ912DRAFT_987939 [Pholiota molesta]